MLRQSTLIVERSSIPRLPLQLQRFGSSRGRNDTQDDSHDRSATKRWLDAARENADIIPPNISKVTFEKGNAKGAAGMSR